MFPWERSKIQVPLFPLFCVCGGMCVVVGGGATVTHFTVFVFAMVYSLPIVTRSRGVKFRRTLGAGFVRNGTNFVSLITVTLVINLTFYVRHVVCLDLSRVGTGGLVRSVSRGMRTKSIRNTGRLYHGAHKPMTSVYCRKLVRVSRRLSSVRHSMDKCNAIRTTGLRGKYS